MSNLKDKLNKYELEIKSITNKIMNIDSTYKRVSEDMENDVKNIEKNIIEERKRIIRE